MNGFKVKRLADRYAKGVENLSRGKIYYATVSSGNENDAGQTDTVSVVTEEGLPIPRINAGGRKVAEGARVKLRGDGLKGSETFALVDVVQLSANQEGSNQNHVIDTPEVAEVKQFNTFLQSGIPVIWAAVIIWQIAAQWRYGQHVRYELEWREASGNQTITTRRTDPFGQILFALDSEINTITNPIPVSAVTSPPTSTQASARFGRIEFLDGEVAAYSLFDQSALEYTIEARGVDNSDGIDTTPASHGDGELVRQRTTTVTIPDLQSATAYEYRVRSLIGQQTSNWGDWENFITQGAIEATRLVGDLVSNGDFSANVTDWTAVSTGTLSHDATHGFRGLGCAVIEEDGDTIPTSTNFYQDTISITGGNKYTLEMYVSTGGDIEAIDEFYIQLALGGVTGLYQSVKVLGANMLSIDNNQWVQFIAQGVAPYGATEAVVSLVAELNRGVGETSFIYIDDVRLHEEVETKGTAVEAAADFDRLGAGGGSGAIVKIIHYEETWNPPSVISEGYVTHTITGVTGVNAGDKAKAGFNTLGDNDMELSATVTGSGRIFIVLRNFEGGNVDLASGTLSVEITRSET